MFSRLRRTTADLRSDERGNVLATVMLVSLLVGSLSALTLATGNQADTSSTKDRNHDQSLGAAEAGVHEAIVELGQRIAAGSTPQFSLVTANPPAAPNPPSGSCPAVASPSPAPATYAQGGYYACVTQNAQGYVIDSQGLVGGTHFRRLRHVRVQLTPPNLFPINGRHYALFSYTSIVLKNNDTINGDIWANTSVTFSQNSVINGSLWAAQSWVDMGITGAQVTGDIVSGGFSPGGWAVNVGGAGVGGSVTASSSSPCGSGGNSSYNVVMGAPIGGNLTTWGVKTGSGSVAGTYTPNTCTAAPAAQPIPSFNFNRYNYDQSTYLEFTSVSAFQSWLSSNSSALQGTFYVQDPSPSQSNRIDLTGVTVAGNTTIVTNAPVFTNSINDVHSGSRTFTVVSHYTPPVSSSCDVNHDSSECAVHIKNNFDASCYTAILIYAENGPVAVKNNQTACGSIIGNGMDIKNNQGLNIDPRTNRMVGFGSDTYEIASWQELASS